MKLGGLKVWIMRALIYSILLNLFLTEGWLSLENSFINNIIAGLVLFIIPYMLAHVFVWVLGR